MPHPELITEPRAAGWNVKTERKKKKKQVVCSKPLRRKTLEGWEEGENEAVYLGPGDREEVVGDEVGKSHGLVGRVV